MTLAIVLAIVALALLAYAAARARRVEQERPAALDERRAAEQLYPHHRRHE